MKLSLVAALLGGRGMAAPAMEAALPPEQQRDVEANKANLYTHTMNEYHSFSEVEKRQLDDFADILLARLTERDSMHKRQLGDLLGGVVQGVVSGALKGLQGRQLKARNPTDAMGIATGAVGGLTGGLAENDELHERQLDILTGLLGSLLGGLGSQPPQPPPPDVANDTAGNKTETADAATESAADATDAVERLLDGLDKRQLDVLTGLLGGVLGDLESQNHDPPTPEGPVDGSTDAATGMLEEALDAALESSGAADIAGEATGELQAAANMLRPDATVAG